MTLMVMTAATTEAAFQRKPNLVWLWKDVTVLGMQVYYDILAIIVSPCISLYEQADHSNRTKVESQCYDGTLSGSKMLHITMRNKCNSYHVNVCGDAINKLLSQWGPTKTDELMMNPFSGPLINEHYSKRGIATNILSAAPNNGGSFLSGMDGVVFTDLFGCVWEYINPNSNYIPLTSQPTQGKLTLPVHAGRTNEASIKQYSSS